MFRFRAESEGKRKAAETPDRRAFVDDKHFQLFTYWNDLRGDRLLPRHTEINPSAIQPLLPELSILDYVGPTEVIYRLTGTSVAQRMQSDPLGKNVIAMVPPQNAEIITQTLKHVVDLPAGATTRHVNIDPNGKRLLTHGLYLPLADKYDRVRQILALTLSQTLPAFTAPQQKVTIAGEFELLDFLDIGGGVPASLPDPATT